MSLALVKEDYKIQVGTMFRSEAQLVLLRIEEINEEKDTISLRVADSDFTTEGALSNIIGFLAGIEAKEITEEEWNGYLKTYTDDIKALNEKQQGNKNGN